MVSVLFVCVTLSRSIASASATNWKSVLAIKRCCRNSWQEKRNDRFTNTTMLWSYSNCVRARALAYVREYNYT